MLTDNGDFCAALLIQEGARVFSLVVNRRASDEQFSDSTIFHKFYFFFSRSQRLTVLEPFNISGLRCNFYLQNCDLAFLHLAVLQLLHKLWFGGCTNELDLSYQVSLNTDNEYHFINESDSFDDSIARNLQIQ